MDPYDSDSSGLEDEGEYTETGVLLGYSSEEPTGDTISQLGGWPAWSDPSSPPPGSFANCKVCRSPMPLLLQLHGDLPEHFPNDERRLYVFGCTKKTCARKSGSIRALRGVKKHKPQKPQKPQSKRKEDESSSKEEQKNAQPTPNLGSSIFGSTGNGPSSNPNPFSTSTTASSSAANPFAPLPPPSTLAAKPPQKPSSTTTEDLPETFASKVRVSSPPPPAATPSPAEPWPSESSFPAPYQHYHLDAEYETLSRPSTPATTTNPKIDTEDSTSSAADTKDAFESSLDKSFLRFSARLEHNPEQVLRYEFRGTPILYSTTDAVGKLFSPAEGASGHVKVSTSAHSTNRIPRCESCGRERVFELQLVPHAISVLEEGRSIGLGEKDDAGMEWGTIILGVCAGDCGEEGVVSWKEEWVGVQWEERG